MIYLRLVEGHEAFNSIKESLPENFVIYDNEHVHYPGESENYGVYKFICFYATDGETETGYLVNQDIDIDNPKDITITVPSGLTSSNIGEVFISNKPASEITPFSFVFSANFEDESYNFKLNYSQEDEVVTLDDTSMEYVYLSQMLPGFSNYHGYYAYGGAEIVKRYYVTYNGVEYKRGGSMLSAYNSEAAMTAKKPSLTTKLYNYEDSDGNEIWLDFGIENEGANDGDVLTNIVVYTVGDTGQSTYTKYITGSSVAASMTVSIREELDR